MTYEERLFYCKELINEYDALVVEHLYIEILYHGDAEEYVRSL